MTGNRVEELESKVRELEATVSGLTDELVETKERLRTVEEHADLELDAVFGGDVGEVESAADRGGRVARIQGQNADQDARRRRDRGDPDGPASQEDVEAAVANAADDPSASGGSGGSGASEASAEAEPPEATSGSGTDASTAPDESPAGAADTVEPSGETTFIDADEVDHGEDADASSADGANSGGDEGGEESGSDDIIVA